MVVKTVEGRLSGAVRRHRIDCHDPRRPVGSAFWAYKYSSLRTPGIRMGVLLYGSSCIVNHEVDVQPRTYINGYSWNLMAEDPKHVATRPGSETFTMKGDIPLNSLN